MRFAPSPQAKLDARCRRPLRSRMGRARQSHHGDARKSVAAAVPPFRLPTAAVGRATRMSVVAPAMKNEQLGREDWTLPQPTTMVEVARVGEQRGAAAWGA